MRSEYDPLFSPDDAASDDPRGAEDLDRVREVFAAASGPYLRSAASWLAWGLVLPATALAHPRVLGRWGLQGVVLLWSVAILIGGAVELAAIFRGGSRIGHSTPLVGWVFRMQGNLSAVALALSAVLVWQGSGWLLPGLWLLLVGHSFYLLGGLAFRPFRLYGLFLQGAGVLALWPGGSPLAIFGGATGAANLWMALKVWRRGR